MIESGLTNQGIVRPESTTPVCPDHPEANWETGFGFDGGGFGSYRKCKECGRIFHKESK